MSTRNRKFLFWFVILGLVMACVPSFGTPVPTANPNQVNQFIAQTANAAATRTAAAVPTSSLTPTATPTRLTETPSPTFTSTVIFILASPTKVVPPTLIIIGGGGSSGGSGSSGGTSSDRYACQVLSVSPANGTSFKSRDSFDATWKVKNTGTKEWDHNSVDFIYSSGDKFYKVAGYDLKGDVSSGSNVNLGVDMIAPKKSGTYTTTWALMLGSDDFCNMSLTIVVR